MRLKCLKYIQINLEGRKNTIFNAVFHLSKKPQTESVYLRVGAEPVRQSGRTGEVVFPARICEEYLNRKKNTLAIRMTANCTEEIEIKTYSEDLVSFIVEMILVPAVGTVGITGEQEYLYIFC